MDLMMKGPLVPRIAGCIYLAGVCLVWLVSYVLSPGDHTVFPAL